MKVSEILVEYYHPARVDSSKGRSADGERLGRMQGPVPKWLDAINAHMKEPITPEHVETARAKIKSSSEYQKMLKDGWKDSSTGSAVKKGTFVMVRPDGQKYNILVTGKVNDRTGYGGGIRASTTPRILPTDPVMTVVKTMTRSLAHLSAEKASKKED